MRRGGWIVICGLVGLGMGCEGRVDRLRGVGQVVVVVTEEWGGVTGRMGRYERERGGWRRVGREVPVVVGRTGLGWAGEAIRAGWSGGVGPVKREGDGRSPAGLFRLGTAFGEGMARGERRWRLPFWETTGSLVCVDDPRSSRYNRLVDASSLGGERQDWSSAEQMRREDEQYQLGIVVEQNRNPVQPGEGSCIFLHLWEGPDRGTIGCTAMDRESLLELLAWLDGAKTPHLLQLPRSEWDRLRRRGQLPWLLGSGELD